MPEQTKCLFCETEDARPLLRRVEPRHVVCRTCGLVYQNPRPTLDELAAYYVSGYWEVRHATGIAPDPPPNEGPGDAVPFSERGQAFVDWAGSQIKPADLVLEVGCGEGRILAYIRQQLKCGVVGIEPSREEAERARQRLGLEILCGSLDGADLGGRQPRAMVLAHVLEHFHDPRAALRRCFELLAPDGLIFIEVPNMLNPNPTKRLGRWLQLEHLYYYSPNTLRRLLDDAGFVVERMEPTTVIRALARKPAAKPASPRSLPSYPNEYRAVRRAVLRHEMQYWPRRVCARFMGTGQS